jgi:hypothetical protein
MDVRMKAMFPAQAEVESNDFPNSLPAMDSRPYDPADLEIPLTS